MLRFSFFCVLCFQRQPFSLISDFTATRVKCHVAVVKRLPELRHSADYFCFISFGITEPILVTFKKGKRKVQEVPQSQAAALPRHQEEEETDKT